MTKISISKSVLKLNFANCTLERSALHRFFLLGTQKKALLLGVKCWNSSRRYGSRSAKVLASCVEGLRFETRFRHSFYPHSFECSGIFENVLETKIIPRKFPVAIYRSFGKGIASCSEETTLSAWHWPATKTCVLPLAYLNKKSTTLERSYCTAYNCFLGKNNKFCFLCGQWTATVTSHVSLRNAWIQVS